MLNLRVNERPLATRKRRATERLHVYQGHRRVTKKMRIAEKKQETLINSGFQLRSGLALCLDTSTLLAKQHCFWILEHEETNKGHQSRHSD